MLGCSTTQDLAKSFPIVCVILALDSWNYCSGEQDPIARHPFLNVYLYGFIELEAVAFPVHYYPAAREFS